MIKKIADVPRPCLHPGHNPPMHMGIRYLYDISFRDVAVDA